MHQVPPASTPDSPKDSAPTKDAVAGANGGDTTQGAVGGAAQVSGSSDIIAKLTALLEKLQSLLASLGPKGGPAQEDPKQTLPEPPKDGEVGGAKGGEPEQSPVQQSNPKQELPEPPKDDAVGGAKGGPVQDDPKQTLPQPTTEVGGAKGGEPEQSPVQQSDPKGGSTPPAEPVKDEPVQDSDTPPAAPDAPVAPADDSDDSAVGGATSQEPVEVPKTDEEPKVDEVPVDTKTDDSSDTPELPVEEPVDLPTAEPPVGGATGSGSDTTQVDDAPVKTDEPTDPKAPEQSDPKGGPAQSDDPKGSGDNGKVRDHNHGWYVSQAAHADEDVRQVAQSMLGMPTQSQKDKHSAA
jgi:hypothetical protein